MKRARVTRTELHPLYGEIPLIEESHVGLNGRTYTWWRRDPEFRPQLPPGAVRGNPAAQNYCSAHHVPRYFYVDERHTCVQCGSDFLFSAKEQKFWYETLRFISCSRAIRCPSCRKHKRTDSALRAQLAQALRTLGSSPRDPHACLLLAATTVEYRRRTGQGNLQRAIHACRVVQKEWPEAIESLLLEAKCHLLASRPKPAAQRLEELFALASSDPRSRKVVREAKELLPDTQ